MDRPDAPTTPAAADGGTARTGSAGSARATSADATSADAASASAGSASAASASAANTEAGSPDAGSADPTGGHASIGRRLRPAAAAAVIVVLLDQATKAVVRDRLPTGDHWPEGWELLRFSHIENDGAAFGILQGAEAFLLVSTVVGIAALIGYLLWVPGDDRRYTLGFGLVLGGAVGNLIDRVRLGAVTDFIDPTHYPAFNLADSAIVVGVFGLVLLAAFAPPEQA